MRGNVTGLDRVVVACCSHLLGWYLLDSLGFDMAVCTGPASTQEDQLHPNLTADSAQVTFHAFNCVQRARVSLQAMDLAKAMGLAASSNHSRMYNPSETTTLSHPQQLPRTPFAESCDQLLQPSAAVPNLSLPSTSINSTRSTSSLSTVAESGSRSPRYSVLPRVLSNEPLEGPLLLQPDSATRAMSAYNEASPVQASRVQTEAINHVIKAATGRTSGIQSGSNVHAFYRPASEGCVARPCICGSTVTAIACSRPCAVCGATAAAEAHARLHTADEALYHSKSINVGVRTWFHPVIWISSRCFTNHCGRLSRGQGPCQISSDQTRNGQCRCMLNGPLHPAPAPHVCDAHSEIAAKYLHLTC